MKILMASITAPGHLNPLLGIARTLTKHGHEVLVQTGAAMKPSVEAAGLPFTPLLPEADIGAPEYLAKYPERQEKTPGMEMIAFDFEHFFLPQIPAQTAGLKKVLRTYPADIILAESFFLGTLPLLLGARETSGNCSLRRQPAKRWGRQKHAPHPGNLKRRFAGTAGETRTSAIEAYPGRCQQGIGNTWLRTTSLPAPGKHVHLTRPLSLP